MKFHPRFFLLSFVFWSLTQFFHAPSAPAAPLISGTYKITQNTDLGSEVRITVELELINPNGTPVTINKVAIRSLSATTQVVSVTLALTVQGHSNSQVSLQFLLPKKDFTTWHSGPQQLFLISLTPSGGTSSVINLPLLRTQG